MYSLMLLPNLFLLFLINPIQNLRTEYVNVKISEKNFKLEAANTAFKRSRGLMFKSEIENGMLFSFANATRPGFYNKNVKYPLDFFWVNEDLEITEHSQLPANTFESVFPSEKIKYVIEFKQGDIKNPKDLVGKKLEFILD